MICPHVLLQCVCGDGGATGVRDRSERYTWTNPPCTPRCCYCWHPPTMRWVDDTHLPSLRWSSCMWFLSNTVWMSLLFWLRVISVNIFFFIPLSLILFSFVGQYSALTQSNQEKKGKQCLEIKRLPCRREIVGGERGRNLRVTQINPLRLAEEWRRCGD
ncbi:putative retrotransposon hot spot protein (RHS,) [Trypanosoma cruzi]|uniref:Putative retrotransposon hot spot protein (RHS,) n=1 Tax=Trypanosoma cruzi TaxID=5693 RepID=A0A2V2V5H6_TRYCR|nr:putative retrotransposon hot spot protein (RHS,) [Trypanosoma cruzi]